MSGYRKEWPCCGDETYTEAWEPEKCPFCELNDAKDRIAELETELEAAQAPASGEVEPVGEKGSLPWFCRVYNSGYHAGHHDTVEGGYTHVYPQDMDDYHEDVVIEILEDLQQEGFTTHPTAKVPEDLRNRLEAWSRALTGWPKGTAIEKVKSQIDKLLTTPTPATTAETEWKPAHGMSDDLPLIGEPVMGYHRDWIDEDFCKDGIRECFLFGDGSEWQSARWDGYSDQWIVEDGAPELWHSHPTPPKER